MFRTIRIDRFERGLIFKHGELTRVLEPGRHWLFDPFFRLQLETACVLEVYFEDFETEAIARSVALEGHAQVIELGDSERALVWVDGRFERILGAGAHVLWDCERKVEVERIDARKIRLLHRRLDNVLAWHFAFLTLEEVEVADGQAAVVRRNGHLFEVLGPGRAAYWKAPAKVSVELVDLREQHLDVVGQELMTADRVTLRMNAMLRFRIVDPVAATTAVTDVGQALYRLAQLALREVVGATGLERLLTERELLTAALHGALASEAKVFGIEVIELGLRDLILPGEMRELLNRVTEAKAAAEAERITRREETAAMRSQANTARILEANPMLQRLRELEVLEKVAASTNLQVVLGEQGLSERLLKLI